MALKHRLSLAASVLPFFACGSAPPSPPEAPPTRVAAPDGKPAPAPSASAASVTPALAPSSTSATAAAAARAAGYDDQTEAEHGQTITMTPLVQKGAAKSTFPKRTVGDKECWQGAALEGDAKKDFDVIIGKCGSPTGLVEYAHAVTGKLHHEHDKRDTYKLKLAAGMCYRYFAVADAGVKDLDILVTKPNGALVADDKTSHPVAIIEFDKSWCMDEDAEYDFHIEVDGVGTGHYMFGVWVKPKGA